MASREALCGWFILRMVNPERWKLDDLWKTVANTDRVRESCKHCKCDSMNVISEAAVEVGW